MTSFLLRPIDWVSFGEPRPNAASETHHRGTALPPSPTTFQGIVRTALLRASGVDLTARTREAQAERDALVGGPDDLPRGWQLHGPFVADVREDTLVPWVKAPRLLLRKEKSDTRPRRARLIAPPHIEGSEGPSILNDLSPIRAPSVLGDSAATDPFEGWLSPGGLRKALEGDLDAWREEDHHADRPPFITSETLPGLAINSDTWTAEDGMLFFSKVLRFKGRAGLVGRLTGTLPGRIPSDALTRGDMAACGWRSRPAALEAAPPNLDADWAHVLAGLHLPNEVREQQTFFLVALTPVPCTRDPSLDALERDLRRNVALPDGVTVHLHARMTGKPITLGGLMASTRRSRPNQSFWDAGSAFLISLRGGDDAARANALRRYNNAHTLGSRSGAGPAAFGYGHTLVGQGAGDWEETT